MRGRTSAGRKQEKKLVQWDGEPAYKNQGGKGGGPVPREKRGEKKCNPKEGT